MPKYIRVRDGEVDETKELVAGELFADIDANGKLLGIEVLAEPEAHPETELLHAWMWNCEHCGAENFERCITKELNDQDIEDGIVPEFERHDYAVFGHPDTVKCHDCGTLYTPRVAGSEYDDE